jgi:hypothetical protein
MNNVHKIFDQYESDRPQPLPHDTIPCPAPDFADYLKRRVKEILENGDGEFEGNLFDTE